MQRGIPQDFRGIVVLMHRRQRESEQGHLMSGKK
jgi:hypothetical protein